LITGLIFPYALAVDASGNIYVAGEFDTTEYTATGACVSSCRQINVGAAFGVALDSADDVFVADQSGPSVNEYDSSAEHLLIENPELEAEGTFASPRGLVINDTTHTLYVVDEGSMDVKIFEFVKAKPPLVTTEPTTRATNGHAGELPAEELHGTIDPNGTEDAAGAYFEYGTESCHTSEGTCGAKVVEPSQVPLIGEAAIPVSVRLDNLAPYTTYHDWAVGINQESGAEHGEEQTFTTGGPIPPEPGSPSEGSSPASGAPTSALVPPLLTSIVPVPPPKVVVKRTLTRAQLLAKALATCARKPAKQRATCKRQARRKYGPVTKHAAKQRGK
jgi:hypothetical protein